MDITRKMHICYGCEKAKQITIDVCAATDIGLLRRDNEDNFLLVDLSNDSWSMADNQVEQTIPIQSQHNRSVLAVADGNPGSRGRITSQLTLETLRDSLFEYQKSLEYQTINFSKQIDTAIKTANEAIFKLTSSNNEYCGCCTTLTVVAIENDLAYIAQVGETRAYLIRGEKIVQITTDQTMFSHISPPEGEDPNKSHGRYVLLNAVGAFPKGVAIFHSLELADGDILLLNTDGLTKMLKDEEIVKIIRESASIDLACSQLINAANEKGGHDNIACILAKISGDLPVELAITPKQLSKKTFIEYCEDGSEEFDSL